MSLSEARIKVGLTAIIGSIVIDLTCPRSLAVAFKLAGYVLVTSVPTISFSWPKAVTISVIPPLRVTILLLLLELQ